MNWTLPTPLLLFAGVVAVWPLEAVVRRPTSSLRLVAEVFGTTRAVIALLARMDRPLVARSALLNVGDRLVLAPDFAGAVAQADVDPTVDSRAV